jgi:hypothetical protein
VVRPARCSAAAAAAIWSPSASAGCSGRIKVTFMDCPTAARTSPGAEPARTTTVEALRRIGSMLAVRFASPAIPACDLRTQRLRPTRGGNGSLGDARFLDIELARSAGSCHARARAPSGDGREFVEFAAGQRDAGAAHVVLKVPHR